MTGMMQDLEPVPERMAAVAGAGFSTATDLADWLRPHPGHAVPRCAPRHGPDRRRGGAAGLGLEELPLDAMQAVELRITQAIYEVLGVENSVRSRTSFGGTAPEQVARQVAWWKSRV